MLVVLVKVRPAVKQRLDIGPNPGHRRDRIRRVGVLQQLGVLQVGGLPRPIVSGTITFPHRKVVAHGRHRCRASHPEREAAPGTNRRMAHLTPPTSGAMPARPHTIAAHGRIAATLGNLEPSPARKTPAPVPGSPDLTTDPPYA